MPSRFLTDTLEPEDIEVLERLVRNRRYADGEDLFAEGTPASGAFLLRSGELTICAARPGGGRSELAILSAGALVGETALLRDGRRSASATARGDVEAAYLDRRDFQGLCARMHPTSFRLLRHITALVGERMQRTGGDIRVLLGEPREPAPVPAVPFASPSEAGAAFDVRPLMSRLGLLAALTEWDLDELRAASTLWSLPRGRPIFEAGAPSEGAFVVIRGAVEVRTGTAAGGVRLGVLGPGALFGELGILLGRPRSATVRTREDAVLMEIPGETFGRLLTEPGHLGFHLLSGLSSALLERMGMVNRTLARIELQQMIGAGSLAPPSLRCP